MPEKVKICPLLSVGRASDPAPCMGERCGWWHKEYDYRTEAPIGECAAATIADTLTDIKRYGIG